MRVGEHDLCRIFMVEADDSREVIAYTCDFCGAVRKTPELFENV